MFVFKGDHILNLVKFGTNPGIVLISMGMQFGQCTKTILRTAMVNKPTVKVSARRTQTFKVMHTEETLGIAV